MAYKKADFILFENKVWGLLGDCVPVKRYESFLTNKHLKFSLREYCTVNEVLRFKKAVLDTFKVDVDIARKAKMRQIIKQIEGAMI